VVRALDRICDYYRQFEPSSPVPYILKRAQRLAKMNFMEIVSELTPDAITAVKVVTGTEPGETPPVEVRGQRSEVRGQKIPLTSHLLTSDLLLIYF